MKNIDDEWDSFLQTDVYGDLNDNVSSDRNEYPDIIDVTKNKK